MRDSARKGDLARGGRGKDGKDRGDSGFWGGGRRFAGTTQNKGAATVQSCRGVGCRECHGPWTGAALGAGLLGGRSRAAARSLAAKMPAIPCVQRSQPAAISESTAPTDARRRPRLLTPPAHDLTTARDGSLGPLTLTSSSHGANDGLDAAHPVQHPLPHPLPHPHSALHTPTAPLLLLPAEPR
jgi:hypothetical protein